VVPTLIVHALDDPWIPAGAYTRFDWKTHPKLTPLLPAQGGHVGFHGRGTRVAWHDICLKIFFERAMSDHPPAFS
jgi:predicted alpha/beta-fold hydrolase